MRQSESRPDPEKLLKKLQANTNQVERGQLKIFLGAAAGVGKTYAMLKAATQLLAENEDVVIGYIETHGRLETHGLLPPDIEYIPLKLVEYKGSILKEFDIDKTLARKPKYVIVDELAHSNVVDSRNSKRYQDVLELINSGINVYTALNIQHLESLNDIVEQITEIKVTETVPDQILETADEVVLIDIPPEELMERLSEGKIYPKERIQPALNNFFRKGNLTALRELSLRKTAQKVDSQVLQYRNKASIDNIWASNDKLLLILEQGYDNEKMIRQAKNTFDKGYSQWFIAYVEGPKFETRAPKDHQRLIELIELAKQLGATPLNLAGSDPALSIASCVTENNINTVMLAQYKLNLYYRLFGKSLSARLSELVPGININLIANEIIIKRHSPQIKPKTDYSRIWKKILFSSVIFGSLGFVLHPTIKWLSSENILMIYLLVMVIANTGRGRISASIAALMATLSFDFFIVPPTFSFSVSDGQYIITFLVLVTIGITYSIINGNLRFQVSKLSKAQRQSDQFNAFNKELSGVMIENQVVEMVANSFQRMFNAKFMLLLPDLDEELSFRTGTQLNRFDPAIASWVFNNNKDAGLNTDTFSGNSLFYTPILTKVRARGVIVIEPQSDVNFFLPDVQHLLDDFIDQIGITLERIHFTQIAIQTEVALALQQIERN